MQFCKRRIACLVVEGAPGISDQLVELGVTEVAPVVRGWREGLGAGETNHREERIHRRETDVGRIGTIGRRILRAFAPVREQRVPLDDVELHIEVAGLERLLHKLVHRQRLHLARSAGTDLYLDLQRFGRRPAGLTHQLLGGIRVVGDVELRIAPPRVARWDGALWYRHHPTKQLEKTGSVNAEVGSMAHALIQPRRAFGERQLPGPDVRLLIEVDLVAAALDLRHGIGRRRLDPVDLS